MASLPDEPALIEDVKALSLAGSSDRATEPHTDNSNPETDPMTDKVAAQVTTNKEATRVLSGYLREKSPDFDELCDVRNVVGLQLLLFHSPFG